MLNYKNSIKYLYNLEKIGIKLGLENTKKLLMLMNNPQNIYPTVHIAGTNGKGSTSAMIASILTASGYKTGLYTSPHLIKFNERIRINGIPISDSMLVKYVNEFLPAFKKIKPTFFEATTTIAFKYFADYNVDIAVIETGMGGRLDSTNVVKPLLSIITSIGRDHTQYLGNTLKKIAFEKAGIIKEKVPCLTAVEDPDLLRVFKKVAKDKHTKIEVVTRKGKVDIIEGDLYKYIVNIRLDKKVINNLVVDLSGDYQKNNILLALSAVEMLKNRYDISQIDDKSIRNGLNKIKKLSGLRGRFEKISEKPLIIGDVAHNQPAFQQLKRSLMSLGINDAITIFGVMKDKDVYEIVPYIMDFSKLVITSETDIPRAMKSNDISTLFKSYKFPCIDGKSVRNALKIAKKLSREEDVIIITGSHYILGEAIKLLKS